MSFHVSLGEGEDVLGGRALVPEEHRMGWEQASRTNRRERNEAPEQTEELRAPKDHANMRMISGIPLMLGPGTRM